MTSHSSPIAQTRMSSEISNKSSPTHPECSCSNCCPGSKIPTYHSCSEICSLGLKFLNELNIKSSLSLTKFSIPLSHHISMTLYPFSLLMVTIHALHLMSLLSNHHHRSKSLTLLPTCFTSSFEPASYITQDSSSKLFIPLSATFIWTCRFNLLHSAITFHHYSLFHFKTYFFRKCYPPP